MEDFLKWVLQGVLTVVVGLMAYLFKGVKEEIDELQKDLNAVKVELPTKYITKEDFQIFETKLFNTLDRIQDKLDTK